MKFLGCLFVAAALLDFFLPPSGAEVKQAFIIELALAITAASALFGATTSTLGYLDARKARKSQEKLEAQRKDELAREGAERAAAAKRAESAGSRTGRRASLTGFGFGASGGGTPGLGTGNLFGN